MAGFLAFVPYALAAYGGYKGYQASKEAGGSGLQRLLAGATGAALGYYGGKAIPGVSAAGFGSTAAGGIPSFTQLGPVQSFAGTSAGQALGLSQAARGPVMTSGGQMLASPSSGGLTAAMLPKSTVASTTAGGGI